MFQFTRHGFREMLVGTLALMVVAVAVGWVWWPLALLTLPILIWLFAFFRDPHRIVPGEQHVMVSPADGKVSDITEIAHDDLIGGPCVRVGIFLSVFNVHINRAPCDGRIGKIIYKRGKFINAMSHNEASSQNESNTVVLLEPDSAQPIAVVKQIVGLIARRIICTVATDESVTRGQRIGMIKFGSRTELYIPARLKPTVRVSIGENVRGASTIIATLGIAAHGTPTSTVDAAEFEPLLSRETPS